MSLSEEFEFISTPDGSAPSGRRKKNTFKNVSFTGMTPQHIDVIDSECMQQGICRAAWIMNALGSPEGHARARTLMEGIKHKGYSKVLQKIDEQLKEVHP